MAFSWVLRSSLAYGLFLGVVSLIIFAMRIAGIRVSFIPVTICAFAISLIALKNVPFLPRERMTWIRLILIFFIIFNCVLVGLEAVSSGINSVDGFHIWGLKGYSLYRTVNRPFGEMAAAVTSTTGSDYPLLVPLSELWVSMGIGRWDDQWVKIIFPLFTCAFLGVFYCCLRRFMNDPAAIFFTFLLSTVGFVSRIATHNGADIPLMYYYSTSTLCMVVWFRERGRFWLAISGVFLALGMWTKFEGIAAAGINIFVIALYCAFNREAKVEHKRDIIRFMAWVLAASTFIIFYRILLNTPYQNNIVLNARTLSGVFSHMPRLNEIGYSFQKELFGAPNKWGMAGYVFAATLLLYFRKCMKQPYVYLLWIIALNFAFYALIYLFTNFDLKYHIETTWTRMLLHFIPLLIFFSAIVLVPDKEQR